MTSWLDYPDLTSEQFQAQKGWFESILEVSQVDKVDNSILFRPVEEHIANLRKLWDLSYRLATAFEEGLKTG